MTIVTLEFHKNLQATIDIIKKANPAIQNIVMVVDMGQTNVKTYTTGDPDETDELLEYALDITSDVPRGIIPSEDVDKE